MGNRRLSQSFSNLFNAYTKAFNKQNNRSGTLFERPFHRIEVGDENYMKYLIYYIHHNPVHHGFCEDMIEYPWNSYLTILSPKKTRLSRKQVLSWFDDNKKSFQEYHSSSPLDPKGSNLEDI